MSLSVESLLDRLGVDYRETTGASGPQYNICECPSCGDDRWKVYMNAESGLANCFVCDTKFNPYTFAKATLKCTPKEAVETLKEFSDDPLNWSIEKVKPVVDSVLALPESVTLPHNGSTLEYLNQRGITVETLREFDVRYCDSGVFRWTVDGEQKVMDFSKRIIFPVYDMHHTLVSYQGRDVTCTSKRKYMNPPGFPLSGKHLYHIHRAIGKETVVIGEGVFDAMAIYQAVGDRLGVVASFGKHFAISSTNADDQLSKLMTLKSLGMKSIIFAWDGTRDAIQAAVETMSKLDGYGFQTRLCRLPDDRDPNEVAKDTLLDCIHSAQPYSTQMLVLARMGRL